MHFYSNVVQNYGSKLEPSDTLEDFPGLSTVYLRVPWAFVEPEEGQFNWALLDTPAQRWIAKGKRVAIAVTCSEHWIRYATPKWVEDAGASLAYLPDHEPALGCRIEDAEPRWVSGLELAGGCDLLLHDAQYTAAEYAERPGWGHSAVGDAVAFALRAGAGRLGLFHHDPGRSDRDLEALLAEARRLWARGGRDPAALFAAAEGLTLEPG